jgi:hypothetical protein
MQSEPHSSGHGMPFPGNATSRAKIHRGCTDYFMRRRATDKSGGVILGRADDEGSLENCVINNLGEVPCRLRGLG